MALISEYSAADLSADASGDALAIINIGNQSLTLHLAKDSLIRSLCMCTTVLSAEFR